MGGHIQLKPSWSFPNVNSLNRVYAQRGELRVRQYIERATEDGDMMMNGMDPAEIERERLRRAVIIDLWA